MATKKVDYIDSDSNAQVTENKNYQHYVKAAPELSNFEEVYKLEHHLVHSYEELMDFYKNKFVSDSFFAWDTETTSLNPEQGEKTGDFIEGIIVGYSFTQDGHNGYYVPIKHPDIAIGYKGLKVLYAMICRSKLNLLYNARFDMRFLEFMTPEKYGYTPESDEKIYPFDLSNIKYLDVQCATWLADTNIPMPSLKKSEKHFLGWVPPTFAETTGGEGNFGYLPAVQGYRYASIDALGTYHLFFKTERYLTESGAAGKLDNEILYPLMKLENTPIYVDHEYLKNIRGDILKHLEDLKQQLYTAAGYEFNISAARELIGVFQSMGIDTGYRTATGTMKTDIKTLDIYMSSHGDNDFIKKLIEYKKLLKFDNSYLKTLLEISDPNEVKKHPIRFNYFTCRVPSGRLAAGTDGKNTFFSPVNFQSLPKPHSHNYHCHKATPEQIANKEDICGYIFDDNPENSLGLVEGQDPHLNVRMAIHPPTNDAVIISVDMCLEGGSPVQTKRGYIGISEVKVGDEILTPNGYANIVRIKNTGKKPLYKIKTDGQAIYCSEDHPFMINNEQVPANQIKDILIQEPFKPYVKYNDDKRKIFLQLQLLNKYKSIKEKAEYIINNNLITLVQNALNKYARNDVARACNINVSSFNHFLTYIGMPTSCNKCFKCMPNMHTNNPFVESTPTSAYLLGYILGDGNISIRRNNYCTLNITSKDYKQIEQIANIFSDDIKITKHVKNGKYIAYSISIVDQNVCKSLIELGIKPRKSYVNSSINFEWLGNNLNHFIRGLIDADGCIRIKNDNQLEITVAGHESYIKEIFNHMINQWSIYKPKNENILIINKLWANTDRREFYKYLYTNATIWLQRKRDVFDNYIINKYGNLPEFDMYDITIDSDDHVYLCNGIKTHNCAEELRMAANVYNEPTWIKAFNTGQDVHKATAYKIFGEENYCKEARKRAKVANFGILYGASAYGFHNSFPDMSLEECEDFIEKFKLALPSIEKSQKNAVRYAKKNGYIKTYFGRPRRVKYYLEHPTRKMRSFGERTVKNTAIQGAAGDCLKLMLVRLWKDLFVPYKDKGVRWVGTIHDEINYVVPRSLVNEVAPIIMRCQTIKLPDWKVVLEPDMSIGTSFGSLIPFYVKYNEDGTLKELVPQIEEIKEKDMHPSDTINEYVPEVAEDTYDYMQ
jgi:DNA polymerase I-like protein with 3'-5' exonuclease and polymerase domains